MSPPISLLRSGTAGLRLTAVAALIVGLLFGTGVTAELRAEDADQPAVIQEHGIEGVALTMEIDRREIAIDGRIRATLRLEMSADHLGGLPELADRLGPFAVVMQSPVETSSGDGMVQLRRYYEFEPEGVGELTLPALVVPVRDRQGGDGPAGEIRTDPVSITVASVVPEGVDYTEPKDIAPPLSLPRPGLPAAVWIGLGVLAATGALAVLAWRRWRRRAVRRLRPQPAHLVTLAELDRLRQAALDDDERIDAFYVRLSAILRQYLGWRFGLRALMQTTEEVVTALPSAESGLAPYRSVLSALLANFDRVKFARYRPEPSDMDKALRWVREFVERTGDERVLVDPSAAQLA
jgi:hypothetical protein